MRGLRYKRPHTELLMCAIVLLLFFLLFPVQGVEAQTGYTPLFKDRPRVNSYEWYSTKLIFEDGIMNDSVKIENEQLLFLQNIWMQEFTQASGEKIYLVREDYNHYISMYKYAEYFVIEIFDMTVPHKSVSMISKNGLISVQRGMDFVGLSVNDDVGRSSFEIKEYLGRITRPDGNIFPDKSDFADMVVEIYADYKPEFFGRSENRSSVYSVPFYKFKSSTNTLAIPRAQGFLTAVVLDSSIVERLAALPPEGWQAEDNSVVINVEQRGVKRIYTLEVPDLGLEFSFSVQKPDARIMEQISITYDYSEYWEQVVQDHYMENYVIRVYSAENIIDPSEQQITFDEALIVAAIIGDKSQWLWGIRDSLGFLELIFSEE